MLLMDTPSLLTWGLRIYFYLLLIWSFNIPSGVGMVLSLGGFLIMEVFCQELYDEYRLTPNSKLFDNPHNTFYNHTLN
jgi:hypothetical protein